VYWRVEGSLLDLTVVQPVAFFTWNAQTFSERFRRRGLIFVMAALRPFLYSTNRKFATRVVHTALRGVTRDRLDLLGEEYFQYKLKPQLKAMRSGARAGTGAHGSGCDSGQPGPGTRDEAAGAASGSEGGLWQTGWNFAMAWRRDGCWNR
jgi:hypothetical protein